MVHCANRSPIPFDCDSFSRQTLYEVLAEIEEVQAGHNEDLLLEGIVVKQLRSPASSPRRLLDELAAQGLPIIRNRWQRSGPVPATSAWRSMHEE